MDTEDKLIHKLRAIEALFSGAGTEGEKQAAGLALQRILSRLEDMRQKDPPREYQFSMTNPWSRQLLVALLRRYGLEPFRYHRQRYTTVMVKVPVRFVEETLWPEFVKLNETLLKFLDETTGRIIKEGVNRDDSEVRVMKELGPGD